MPSAKVWSSRSPVTPSPLEPRFNSLNRTVSQLLGWRPQTLLDLLLAVAVAGIVVALALIVGAHFHLLSLLF